MTDSLKERVFKYIYDYYTRFDDNEVMVGEDGISVDFKTYDIDNVTHRVNKDNVLSYGSLVFREDDSVVLTINDTSIGYSATVIFTDWNHFIEYKKATSDGLDDCYMNWDSYIL